jgi:hypothetical protein
MVIPTGITSSWAMKQPGGMIWNYQLRDEESIGGMGFRWKLLLIDKNTLEEWHSVGNFLLMDADSDQ